MSARVVNQHGRRGVVIVVTLDPDEAENVAHALGLDDGGAQELLDAAERARKLNEEADDDR